MKTRRDVELIGDDCLYGTPTPLEATCTDLKMLVKEFNDRKDLSRNANSKILLQ